MPSRIWENRTELLKMPDQINEPAPQHESQCIHLETAAFLGGDQPRQFDRVLVTGLGRSGTSAIGSLLHHEGFWMGKTEEINSSLRENDRLHELLMKRKYDELYSALNEWTANHQRVAWKDPKLFLGKHRKFCQNLPDDWLFIVTLRDPMANAQRRMSLNDNSFIETLHHVCMNQKVLCQFIEECRHPMLLVTYEKFLQQPETAIGEIRQFLGEGTSDALSDHALYQLMQEDKLQYREYAENQKSEFEEQLNSSQSTEP